MAVGDLLRRKWGLAEKPGSKPRPGRVEIKIDAESEVLLRILKLVSRKSANALLQVEVSAVIKREAEVLRQSMSEEQWHALVAGASQEGAVR